MDDVGGCDQKNCHMDRHVEDTLGMIKVQGRFRFTDWRPTRLGCRTPLFSNILVPEENFYPKIAPVVVP